MLCKRGPTSVGPRKWPVECCRGHFMSNTNLIGSSWLVFCSANRSPTTTESLPDGIYKVLASGFAFWAATVGQPCILALFRVAYVTSSGLFGFLSLSPYYAGSHIKYYCMSAVPRPWPTLGWRKLLTLLPFYQYIAMGNIEAPTSVISHESLVSLVTLPNPAVVLI